ncbi:flagellar filament capping protein FliD [Mesobacillus zeae]|uniref:Flagellar hook-associated protein 2 n=1 Tax=Mesobacillus zeae TaxID=1917180 RepID=A0A398B4U6_9BACI|nr:flagellar filament capping protein FliD [Mesobacillus zeae]RID84872.1 flagellar hook protein [Mesobacillus zeae]
MVRVGGLASGMDIDQIVGDMMKAERIPLNKLKQKKQVIEWQRDDYRAMNSQLLNFRSELTSMKLSTKYRARTVSSTYSDRVTATASSAASTASYSIDKVTQLATSAVLKNGGGISASSTEKVNISSSLYEAKNSFGSADFNWASGSVESQTIKVADGPIKLKLDDTVSLKDIESMNVKVNGKAFQVVSVTPPEGLADNQVLAAADGTLTFKTAPASGATINVDYFADKKIESSTAAEGQTVIQLAKGSVNGLTLTVGAATLTMDPTAAGAVKELKNDAGEKVGSVDTTTGKVTLDSAMETGAAIKADYTQNYFTFSVASHTSKGLVTENFGVQGSESLNQVMSHVNSSGAGVTMFYDSFTDQVTLTRKETGDFNTSGNEIVTSGSFVNNVLKFGGQAETGGQNAIFTINGLETERSSNTFEMSGVTFTLKQTFNDGNAVSLNVSNDANQVYDNIKAFVDKYNELIDKIGKKTSEEKYKSYQPLTDEQRESLSEKQQEQWEEKAKSGLLKRDPILTGALSKMRSDFYAPVENAGVDPMMKQLTSIGIKTSANYLEGGKLEIDEAKLKKAIEENPESVENLFRGEGATSSSQGIAHRLYNSVNETMDKLKQRAGNSFSTNKQFALGRQIENVDSQIGRFETRMKQVEDRYWRQFTAMEKAIQKSNSQSAYLMQQFGGQ